MNIAVFAWEAMEGIPVGGGALYASRLAAAMARAGHRVRLFTRMGKGQAMDEAIGGIRVRRCPWDRKPGFCEEIEALSNSFAHYFADALGTDGPYDTVHCHEWFTIGAGLKAVAMTPAKLAVSFHSTEWGRTGVWPDAGDSARIAWLEGMGIERADAVVTASFWAKRKITEQYHPPDWKCEVVYHGTDLPAAEPQAGEVSRFREIAGIGPGLPSAMFVGRFSRNGGGDLAARACGLAAARFPEARFVFVGAGPLEGEMRRLAGPGAFFMPPVGGGAPPEFYQGVDLVLAPFRRDYNGRAVLPAWIAAKPALVLRDTVSAEFVMHGANGWTVKDDPNGMAAVIMEAFTDPDGTAWLGRNGQTAAQTAFTWNESAKKLLAVYARRGMLECK